MNGKIVLAEMLCQKIEQHSKEAVIAGSIRRKEPDPRDIDIIAVVNGNPSRIFKIIDYCESLWNIVYKRGNKVVSFMIYGLSQVDIYFTDENSLGAMLIFLTGPSGYGIGLRRRAKNMGWLLNEKGLWTRDIDPSRRRRVADASTERSIFRALGKYPELDYWKAPELRGI
jgi:DNA polymerase (family 10)